MRLFVHPWIVVMALITLQVIGLTTEARNGADAGFRTLVVQAITNHRILPGDVNLEGHPSGAIELTACRREYESGSFVIHAFVPLRDVRLSSTELAGPAGTLPSSAVDLRVVKVWYQSGEHIYIRKGEFILKPELLLKDDSLVQVDHEKKVNHLKMDKDAMRDADTLQPFSLEANTVKQCWVTVRVPADAKAGEYRGSIRVAPQGRAATQVPVTLRVLPFDLDEPRMIRSMYYRASLHADTPTCTSERKTEEQMLAELKDMVAHGVTNPNVYPGASRREDGGWDFDQLERIFALRREAGMVGGPLLILGVNISAPPDLLKATIELAKRHGFTEVYFAAQDEARGEALRAQRADMKRVHDAGGKVFVANFSGDSFQIVGDLLDLPVLSGALTKPTTLATVRAYHAAGGKVMSYANPQGGIEEPQTYRRNYGLALWKAGFDGACTYAYQHAFGHAWDDFDGASGWALRDHNMTYPTVNGVVSTLQWEGYREGYDDLRYVTTLENLIEKNLRKDGPAGEAARAARLWLLRLNIDDPNKTLDQIRALIIDQILDYDVVKDNDYYVAKVLQRGYVEYPVTALGMVERDVRPQTGVAPFPDGARALALDYNHRSLVLDLGERRAIDLIQIYSSRNGAGNINMDGTNVHLYTSDDNVTYRKVASEYLDPGPFVLELSGITAEARYFKVNCTFTEGEDQFGAGTDYGGAKAFRKAPKEAESSSDEQ